MKNLMIMAPLLSSLALAGCAGSGVLLEGRNKLVRYDQYDVVSGALDLEFVLVEENHEDYRNIYDQARDKANVKQVPADVFEYLVESLEEMGFLEMAKPFGADDRPGRFKSISVENEHGRWACTIFKLSRDPPEEVLEERRKFKLMDETVRNCFDSVLSLQVITNQEGGDLFFEEQRRQLEDNKRRQERDQKRTNQ